MVNKELERALIVLKKYCDSNAECWSCPLYNKNLRTKGTPCMLASSVGVDLSANISMAMDAMLGK